MGSRRRNLLTACLAAAVLGPVPAASANDFQTVYREFKRTGTIKPCRFSDKQLANAEHETPPDVEQYAPSFLDALQNAREHGAGCNKKAAAAPPPAATPTQTTPAPAPQTTPTPTAPQPVQTAPPAPTVPAQPTVAGVPSPPVDHPKRSDSAPAAVWILAVLGALAVLAALLGALAWWFGWSAEARLRPFRASSEEFVQRMSDFRVELWDWIRTGT